MGWESFGVVGFDLVLLLQGQTRIAKPKSAHNSLIIGLRGLQCETNLSNLIYCFAGAISSPQRGTQCTDKIIIIRKIKGHSRSVIRSCGCDQEGRKLSWETGIKEVGFEVFPERCD